MHMKAGVSTACLYPVYVENALEKLGMMGIDNTEIFFNTHSELDEPFVRAMKSTLDRYNMSCVSAHPFTCEIDNLMFFSKYKRRFDDIMEYHKKFFNAMNILGAEIFVFHGNRDKTPVSPEFYIERYSKLCMLGKSFGITVAHENVERCQARSLDFIKSLLALDDSLKFTLDIKQCIRSGENPFRFAEEIGKNIVHIHMSDHDGSNDCMQIGNGSFDIEKFLSDMKKNKFDGSVIIELYNKAVSDYSELAENFRRLSEIIERI